MAIIKLNLENIFDSWETHFSVDAMYYHAARQAQVRAGCSEQKINEIKTRWDSLDKAYEETLKKYGDNITTGYDELEPIAIQLSNVHDELGYVYAPLLKEVSIVHILCVATLEAHINSVARDLLNRSDLNHFKDLRLISKWRFLPKLVGLPGFDAGKEPFQGFSRLLKFRNKLVHHKGSKEKWVYGAAPHFIEELGLTFADSQNSTKSTEAMISELAQRRGIEPPKWLQEDIDDTSYFKLVTKSY